MTSQPLENAAAVVESDLQYINEKLKDEFRTMAGKHVLLTGGAGFLGYYFVQSILFRNKRVSESERTLLTVHDNFMRGVPDWLKNLEGDPTLTTVRHDVTDPLPADTPHFDYIIHGASIASPTFYRQHPIETMDANVDGLRLLLEYMLAEAKAGRPLDGFLFFSSSEVYGDPTPENIPTPEDYNGNVSFTGPRACYDESKRYGETLCVNFARQHNLPIKSARPFNNYGPGLKITDRRVLPDFARDIMAGRDIVMLSDGKPTRTFCYVADAICGYFKILVRGQPGEAYNIGVEGPEISMAELADRTVAAAKKAVGYQGKVVKKVSEEADYLTDNPNRRCPIIAKARRDLDYDPSVELEDGLMRSLVWYRDNNHGDDA